MRKVEPGDDFKRQLDLYLKGRLSASQKALFEKQLDDFKKEDPAPYEFNQQQSDDLWKKISAQTIDKETSRRRLWIPLAAAMAFIAVTGVLIFSWTSNKTQLSDKVILEDGTIVWLKNGASLDYTEFTSNDRQVTLEGEALFEVARMRDHPFVIHCGNYEAMVLGTSFNLRSIGNSVELNVLTGTVKLSSLKSDQSFLVNAKEHVVFTETIDKSELKAEDVQTLTKNTEYNMLFEDTRMIDIIRRIEGKFNVHVKLAGDGIAHCMISADFTDQSLPVTLEMISEALGFQYEIHDDEVIITGSGCKE